MSRASSPVEACHPIDTIRREHIDTPEAHRYVFVIVKDAHDTQGPGMTFKIGYLETLKDCFDTFKKACCRTCRAYPEIRFKIKDQVFMDIDTPEKVSL